MILPRASGGVKTRRTSIHPLYVPGRDRPVAFVNVPARLLYKTVDGRKHFVKMPPGIAFDDDVLRRAVELGAVNVQVTDSATNPANHYTVELATFLRHAEVVNRGFGRQLALRFAYWRKNGAPSEVEHQAEAEAQRAAAAEMQQLGLFVGVQT